MDKLCEIWWSTSKSVGGLDGLTVNELSILPRKAVSHLADVLNAIEEGAQWPDDLVHGKGAFLGILTTRSSTVYYLFYQ